MKQAWAQVEVKADATVSAPDGTGELTTSPHPFAGRAGVTQGGGADNFSVVAFDATASLPAEVAQVLDSDLTVLEG